MGMFSVSQGGSKGVSLEGLLKNHLEHFSFKTSPTKAPLTMMKVLDDGSKGTDERPHSGHLRLRSSRAEGLGAPPPEPGCLGPTPGSLTHLLCSNDHDAHWGSVFKIGNRGLISVPSSLGSFKN